MLKRFARFILRNEPPEPRFSEAALESFSFEPRKLSKPTAKALTDSILDRPIEWVRWSEMPEDARRHWADMAKSALNNEALQSLIGKSERIGQRATNGEIVKRCIESIARHSKSHEETEAIRMTINGMELVRELLEEMLLPVEVESTEDIHAAI
jgi:hypothetical protein